MLKHSSRDDGWSLPILVAGRSSNVLWLGSHELIESPFEVLALRLKHFLGRYPHATGFKVFQALQQRAIATIEDGPADVDAQIRIDADQMSVERRVVQRRHADAIAYGCNTPFAIRHDVGTHQEILENEIEGTSSPHVPAEGNPTGFVAKARLTVGCEQFRAVEIYETSLLGEQECGCHR